MRNNELILVKKDWKAFANNKENSVVELGGKWTWSAELKQSEHRVKLHYLGSARKTVLNVSAIAVINPYACIVCLPKKGQGAFLVCVFMVCVLWHIAIFCSFQGTGMLLLWITDCTMLSILCKMSYSQFCAIWSSECTPIAEFVGTE